jgi:hypothetical protein
MGPGIWNNLNYFLLFHCFRWVGVGDATGDYPFSHHKLTIQFSEASAAQDRKLEGLVHKAIRELWRPNPSQLTLLQTKGIGALHKELPKACTLTSSSDPCYIEAYHMADPTDGRITLHLKVFLDCAYFLCSVNNICIEMFISVWLLPKVVL